jgi:hypothetical protein
MAGLSGTLERIKNRGSSRHWAARQTLHIREHAMTRRVIVVSITGLLYVAASAAVAQNAPPSYQADQDVYKVIFEDQNFRVIASTRKKGVHDKVHSHPLPSIVYNVTNCKTRIHPPDDKTMDIVSNAGTAQAVPIIPSHSAENVGPDDCESIFVERK